MTIIAPHPNGTALSAAPPRRRRRWGGLAVVASAAAVLATTMSAPTANAASLTATVAAAVNQTTITATARITASPEVSAALAGICARDAKGNNYDLPLKPATLTTRGTTLTSSRTVPAGTYTYWACAKVDGGWNDISPKRSVVVTTAPATTPTTPTTPTPTTPTPTTPTTPTPTPSTPATPSGEAMPVGDLPGWKQVFSDDFTTAAAAGTFATAYGAKWATYHGFNDTYGNGRYDRNMISVQNGLMDFDIRTVNGQPTSFAPSPIVTKAWKGQSYGRYTARFRADALPGYKTAWLLWPDSNNWQEGEIDFPEGGLDGTMWGFNHCIGNPSSNCFYVNSKKTFTDWHTVTIEWAPGRLTYLMDGQVLGTTTQSVPTAPMHWVLQTETESGKPAPDVAGHLQVDWVSVYTYQP